MTIDKQALRDIAESVEREEWETLDNGDDGYQVIVKGGLERGETYRSYQPVSNEISEQKIAAFIAAFGPATALALLDELEAAGKTSAARLEAIDRTHKMFQREKDRADAAEKRIAELESNEVREVGNQFLVVRHPGKTPVIKHCTGDPEEFLRKLIEQDPLVTIDIITHRYYGIGGQWVQDAVEYLHMMSDAGVRIKGE
ncbi:ead/Ea22-like family protein [Salmonella enterica subsp. enterica serovar Typhimurium]|nr:ead/Ea22-like family protein [Salmonella enterica subsp. enterica serovar Typhimurium]